MSYEGYFGLKEWHVICFVVYMDASLSNSDSYRIKIAMPEIVIEAEPEAIAIDLNKTAVVMIDMQRDFLEPGGFGESLGNDVSLLSLAIEPCKILLNAVRQQGLLVIHTREGHLPDLSDAHRAKVERGDPRLRIGQMGPMGRILIRGEPGQDIIPELYPQAGEPIIDKPGKGAFYATDLQAILQNRAIENLIICGVTTEVCVHTTVREANDRGYRCIVPGDCCGSYIPEFHEAGLNMIKAQGGIFGWVTHSRKILTGLNG
jgi:nicotinamidase-related amidase